MSIEEKVKVHLKEIEQQDELKKVDVEFGDDTILGNPYWIKSSDFIKYMIDKYEK